MYYKKTLLKYHFFHKYVLDTSTCTSAKCDNVEIRSNTYIDYYGF